jgi:hypothetical protein
MGYYSPNSLYVLFKYLVIKRRDDPEYLKYLNTALVEIQKRPILGGISITNQNYIAISIVGDYYKNLDLF